jgi:uncharacterized protein with HEPN domain
MKPETRASLFDVVQASRLIRSIVVDKSRDDFVGDWITVSAVERQFMILGEALLRIRSNEPVILSQIKHGSDAINFRHRLAHHYDGADPNAVFDIAQAPLVQLMKDVSDLLEIV